MWILLLISQVKARNGIGSGEVLCKLSVDPEACGSEPQRKTDNKTHRHINRCSYIHNSTNFMPFRMQKISL